MRTLRLGVIVVLVALLSCEHTRKSTHKSPPPTPAPRPTPHPTRPAGTGGDTTVTFPAGSIIIPTEAAFNDACGAVSSFGLLYNVLRANTCTDGLGACNGYTPIKVYYAYSKVKSSPNRCVPTNKNMPPSPNSGVYSDPAWNDGCDFRITTASGTPIKLVDNTAAGTAASDTAAAVLAASSSQAYPVYSAVTIDSSVTDVGFDGGPFIIAAADVPSFAKLLGGSVSVTDEAGHVIDLSPYRTGKGTCTAYNATPVVHYVDMYRAQAAFTAPANLAFHSAPPMIGVLDLNIAAETKNVSKGILTKYLYIAGITTDISLPDSTGAQGCPTGAYNAASTTYCPNGATHGAAFDLFDWDDVYHNRINEVDATNTPVYGSFWAPHWENNSTPTTAELTGASNIVSFLQRTGVGIFVQCHGIGGMEGENGAFSGSSPVTLQLLTCPNNAGSCGVGTVAQGITVNANKPSLGRYHNCTDPDATTGESCWYYSYPGDPFSQFADWQYQSVGGSIQDFLPDTAEGAMYRGTVKPIISGVQTLDKTKLTSVAAARAMVTEDIAIYGNYNDDSTKGTVHYLAGHDSSSSTSPAGVIYVLQTLLQLGDKDVVYQSYETARSSPVVASLDGGSTTSAIQGTYTVVAPTPTVPQVNLDADAAKFSYPYQTGHLRAINVTNLTTSTTQFSSETTATFDVAGAGADGKPLIPTANYTGSCAFPSAKGSNILTGSSRCRIVFTNTATGYMATSATSPDSDPNWVYINSVNVGATLGTLLGTGLVSTSLDKIAQKVVGSTLGGVDRSTVAVVPASPAASVGLDGQGLASRPTMIYFGATDGMLHAVCGSTNGTYCDEQGRELWAFIPRVELGLLRLNEAQIQGSPRVQDMFGDFYHTGSKAWRTILTFQTGNGTAATPSQAPAVYAIDITDPEKPHILWEFTTECSADRTCTAATTTRRAYELGQGLTLAMGPVQISGATHQVVYAQTNNGGTGGAADVVTAIDVETGKALSTWTGQGSASAATGQFVFLYPTPGGTGARTGSGSNAAVPTTAIPGGAVPVDKTGNGYITDLVFADPYGDVWRVDPTTGASAYGGTTPLFTASQDYFPIGAAPAIYSNGNGIYVGFGTGGYADLNDSTWGSQANQFIAGINVYASGQLTDTARTTKTNGVNDFDIYDAMNTGDRAYAEPTVVGTTVFVTADSTDVNSNTYGTTGSNTGTVYAFTIGNSSPDLTTGIAGGASSLAGAGVGGGQAVLVFGAQSGQGLVQNALGAAGGTGGSSKFNTAGSSKGLLNVSVAKVKRDLWLRTL